MRKIAFLICVFVLTAFDNSGKKTITDKSYRYEFFTVRKSISVKENRNYYWFKSGAIHNSEGGVAGELLDGDFSKFFLDSQLAETGTFSKGLKTGVWKSWHSNGKLQSILDWRKGLMDGNYELYDQRGNLLEKGTFLRNLKHGKWIDYVKKDTVRYRNGAVYIKPKKDSKRRFLFFRKRSNEEKRADSIAKAKKKMEAQKAARVGNGTKNKVGKQETESSAKPGFLKRLFSKTEKDNGKG